jgi:HAD superfamily hydrolase (TIGR01509 family)
MPIRFLYFDLGNVLLSFSTHRFCEQVARTLGVDTGVVEPLLAPQGDLPSTFWQFERGDITPDELHTRLCELGACDIPVEVIAQAASDIFTPIDENLALVEGLHSAGHKLGILSNTNPWHWRFVTDHFPLFSTAFDQIVTSYEARAMKPEAAIYEYAIERAGVEPSEIFFVDDRPENVEGATAAGLDAVVYRDAASLMDELRSRGIA